MRENHKLKHFLLEKSTIYPPLETGGWKSLVLKEATGEVTQLPRIAPEQIRNQDLKMDGWVDINSSIGECALLLIKM